MLGSIVALSLLLAGCSLGGSPPVTTGNNNVIFAPGQAATPPPFPPFTIGAYIADMSPQLGEADRLYVIARVHDATMSKPPMPPNPPVTISATIDGSTQSMPTDADGFAAFSFTAKGTPTQPDIVNVSAVYNGKTYTTTTFYTVLPPISTPTPAPGTTPTPSS